MLHARNLEKHPKVGPDQFENMFLVIILFACSSSVYMQQPIWQFYTYNHVPLFTVYCNLAAQIILNPRPFAKRTRENTKKPNAVPTKSIGTE